MDSIIITTSDDLKKYALMKVLDSVGVFNVKLGKVTIDFDQNGKIGNVKVEQNYRIDLRPKE